MARRTAGYLEKKGLKVYKISNAQHFGFSKTKILYKDGYLQEAYMVAKLIPGYQDFTKLNSLSSSNSHVQLLLGRDSIPFQQILRARSKINLHFQVLRRPHGKARGGRIAGLFNRRATQPCGIDRRIKM